jgi:ubiquinone biosynthesis protein
MRFFSPVITGTMQRIGKLCHTIAHVAFNRRRPDKIRRQLEKSGVLYVKVGQWVSTRTDIFDASITDEFEKLRNESDSMPFMECALAFQNSGFNFDCVDYTPISTGSVAQVHKCVYQGQVVAVKLQRTSKHQEVQMDASLMQYLVRQATNIVGHQGHSDALTSLYEVLGSVEMEFDFKEEARVMRRFHRFYGDRSDIKIPGVIASSDTCIIMEFVETVPFQSSSTVLMRMFFDQLFNLKILHTDMHPGNVAMTPDGKRVVLFDYGSSMVVKETLALCIKQLMVAWANGDTSVMVDYMVQYGMIQREPTSDERVQLQEFLTFVLQYVEHTDIGQFAEGIKTIVSPAASSIQFDPQLFLMFRTFTLLEGTCKALDPDFTILDSLSPLLQDFISDPMVFRLKIEDDIRVFLKNL